ncbi:hypothetical protein HHK36_030689 [Tetracentron sinense]|uniref:non-specific serine/threonine protein kinase n=1 Tax=Tetracentron sinense TaxID=13715 RepID=A0A834YA08_TETSI|nr:hypothetical protein HHK36_030689 [Tetracentron sinense]
MRCNFRFLNHNLVLLEVGVTRMTVIQEGLGVHVIHNLIMRIMPSKMELIYAVVMLASLHSFAASDIQGDALYALKTSLNASPNQLSDWNPNQVNPCIWTNVICEPNSTNVISITLSSMGFSGFLSPKIGVLTTLSTLTLQGNGITGEIPEEFGNLSNLTSLDLENNRLSGQIPSSLGNLKNLKFLILSENNLTGNIPESITDLPNLSNLQLASNDFSGHVPDRLFHLPKYNFTGNNLNCGINFPHLCASDSNDTGASHKSKIGIMFGTIGGVIGLLLCGSLLFFLWKGRHKGYRREVFVDVAGEDDQRIAFGQLKRFAWRELQLATDSFSEKNVLGQGGFGKVYKGVLTDNTKIAVKRLTDYESPGGEAAFLREVEMISVAVHKNLLRLIGFCTTPSERLLVYPFMQNLSVAYRLRGQATLTLSLIFQHLNGGILVQTSFLAELELEEAKDRLVMHKSDSDVIAELIPDISPHVTINKETGVSREIKPGEAVLDWPTRKRVALGTARGLEYLHEHCNPKIIHRDVKAANVLLDKDFEAVVGDFGLAKLVDVRKTNVTTQVRGTMGHIAPEYLSTGKSSERTDVFGYGIMLLELVTGQRAIDFSRLEEEDDVLLLDHVKKLEREKRLDAIVDRNLNRNYNCQEVEMMIQVALLCTQASSEERPTMSDVVRMLEGEGLAERWEEWQQIEVTRRHEYERLQRRFDWGDDSVYNQDAIELSGGR